jgi:hypothetical protein
MSDYRSDQAELLVRGLAALPGGMAMNVVAKKFPRLGPAEAGTGYQQEERSFRCNEIPDPLPVPGGMDEIIITLQGVIKDPDAAQAVRSQVNHLLSRPELGNYWDSRAKFGRADDSYQVTVFSELFR